MAIGDCCDCGPAEMGEFHEYGVEALECWNVVTSDFAYFGAFTSKLLYPADHRLHLAITLCMINGNPGTRSPSTHC